MNNRDHKVNSACSVHTRGARRSCGKRIRVPDQVLTQQWAMFQVEACNMEILARRAAHERLA